MKTKFLISIIAASLTMGSAYAVTVEKLAVERSNGKVDKYIVDDIKEIQFTNGTIKEDGQIGKHGFVDLGLSVLWATTNVGASSVEERGKWYSWGETAPKQEYKSSNYTYSGSEKLPASDDAATVNWSSEWRMPTTAEMKELINNCIWEWVENFNNTGANGSLGTSMKNGNTIFFPATYFRVDDKTVVKDDNSEGYYWTSDGVAGYFTKIADTGIDNSFNKYSGLSVRAVTRY